MPNDWVCPSCNGFVSKWRNNCRCGVSRFDTFSENGTNQQALPGSQSATKEILKYAQSLGVALVSIAWAVGVLGIADAVYLGYQNTQIVVDGQRLTLEFAEAVLYFLESFLPVALLSVIAGCLLAFCGRTLQVLCEIYWSMNPGKRGMAGSR